ncbi:Peptidoglycan binding-like protein [Gottschalkia acidurici 9a]|uniref:Peptidoglycan binding-like protein n=1 Tax=Gottschalkia acidurici (strain ATCC 7906 / DSM 604 / BCRC 14475 / CIP 104303 / KCTC 5404 / NCIMB 10678 / 9a) TaxID=1128398 RepID=K0AZA1_GOTA9|nr:peptidoglycan-binding protein [Gottschalkia acidurici]AFS78025.1 Peptidoglycan binding-like protein [Gottschalkia acidurici 9a]
MKKTLTILTLSVMIASTSTVYAQGDSNEVDEKDQITIINTLEKSDNLNDELQKTDIKDMESEHMLINEMHSITEKENLGEEIVKLSSSAPSLSNVIKWYYRGEPTLSRGSTGSDVLRLQRIINGMGVYKDGRWQTIDVGALDGVYGAKTEEGVRLFQYMWRNTWSEFSVDGIAGKQVWAAINYMIEELQE